MTTTLALGVVGLVGVFRFAGSVAAIIIWAGAVCAGIMAVGGLLT